MRSECPFGIHQQWLRCHRTRYDYLRNSSQQPAIKLCRCSRPLRPGTLANLRLRAVQCCLHRHRPGEDGNFPRKRGSDCIFDIIQLHEVTHILSLNPDLFNRFYLNYTSSVQRTASEVTTTISGRTYITLENVLNYVQTYFDCADGQTGGMLEDDGRNEITQVGQARPAATGNGKSTTTN